MERRCLYYSSPNSPSTIFPTQDEDKIKRIQNLSRKDQYQELKEFICNDCRFENYETKNWIIEGPREIENESVINSNHYEEGTKPLPKEIFTQLNNKNWENI